MSDTELPGAQAQAAKAAARKRPARGISKAQQEARQKVRAAAAQECPLPKGEMGPAMTEQQAAQVFPKSVHELWAAVMDSVRSVEKGDYNKDQHFRFRGIDAVMEAVGPALRAHRVHVRPRRILEHSVTEYTSKSGGRMVNRVVHIEWEVTGPQGDSFLGESMGEAADSGDKSMTKAQSVAYRVYLLNALTVPTGDPDPDAESHERATPSEREQAVQQASAKTYASREDFERERAAQAQQQAGEEDQTQAPDAAEARKEMWREAKKLGWEWAKLSARFKSDYGIETAQADKATLEAFALLLKAEAEEEEELAKKNAAEVLGAKEVQPDEAQSGSIL